LKNDKNLTMIVILLIARNDANKLRRGRENILRNIVSMMRLIEKRDATISANMPLLIGKNGVSISANIAPQADTIKQN